MGLTYRPADILKLVWYSTFAPDVATPSSANFAKATDTARSARFRLPLITDRSRAMTSEQSAATVTAVTVAPADLSLSERGSILGYLVALLILLAFGR